MPVAWLAVFTVIAAALVKIAFIDGMKPGPAVAGPAAEVTIPVVQASRATVTNTVQVAATIQSDAAAGVRQYGCRQGDTYLPVTRRGGGVGRPALPGPSRGSGCTGVGGCR